MKPTLFVSFFLSCLWLGCTSTSQISSDATKTFYTYQTFNELVKGENLDVVLNDGTKSRATRFIARADSVQWIRVDDGKWQSSATRDVSRVETVSRLSGAIEGMFFSAGGGAALLTIPALLLGGSRGGHPSGGLGLVYGAMGGGILGIGVGAAIGHTSEYQFVQDSTQSLE